MEKLDLVNDPDRFDELVHHSAMQASNIEIAYKPGGTQSGNGVAVVSFRAIVNGQEVRVQATTTARLLIGVGKAVEGWEEQTKNRNW